MRYSELVQLYFERSSALQSYWTIYVVVLGGLLGFASMRKERDRWTTLIVSVLYVFFALKNLGAIQDVIAQRNAVHAALTQVSSAAIGEQANTAYARDIVEPTMIRQDAGGVRTFHVTCDGLVLLALWSMELRRKRMAQMREREMEMRASI